MRISDWAQTCSKSRVRRYRNERLVNNLLCRRTATSQPAAVELAAYMMRTLWSALDVIVLVFFCSCDYTQGVKQVRSTADLQTITSRIENGKSQGSVADVDRALTTAVASVNGGRDAWGHPYVWRVRGGAMGVSYIVLSTGSDGQVDVPAIDDYFLKTEREVLQSSEHNRDIVFRDGDAVVTGGK